MAKITFPADAWVDRVDLEFTLPGQTVTRGLYSGVGFVRTASQGHWRALVTFAPVNRHAASYLEAFFAAISDQRNWTDVPHWRGTATGVSAGIVSAARDGGYVIGSGLSRIMPGQLLRARRTVQVQTWTEATRIMTVLPAHINISTPTTLHSTGTIPMRKSEPGPVPMPFDPSFAGPWSVLFEEYLGE